MPELESLAFQFYKPVHSLFGLSEVELGSLSILNQIAMFFLDYISWLGIMEPKDINIF